MAELSKNRFVPVDISQYANSSVAVCVESDGSRPVWNTMVAGYLANLPDADCTLWGIPFSFRRCAKDSSCIIELHPSVGEIEIPLSGRATHICVLHIADCPADYYSNAAGGYELAFYTIKYKDGFCHKQPVRMRFEINCPGEWGRYAFAALPAAQPLPIPEDSKDYDWGFVQTGVWDAEPNFGGWIYAIELPDYNSDLQSFTITPVRGLMAVLAITLYNGSGHPLRYVPRHIYKLALPQAVAPEDLAVEMDLGVITRLYAVPGYLNDSWLVAPDAGLGLPWKEAQTADEYLIEATGSIGASFFVKMPDGSKREIEFGEAFKNGKAQSLDGDVRVEIVDGRKTWVHVTVRDESTGLPTPTRIHFSGPYGNYLPPYGHHDVVNSRWFEDYGGDLQLGTTSYAYVPGEFQIELPEGEVFVEVCKGFEYAPVRRKLLIKHGQRKLDLSISRWSNLRAANWVTADTHVHFISPQTAWLEGQAEGVNLINLLASQWGRLFTNVADITGELSGCSSNDTLVWVGTENRHHLLGHISLLGTKGSPVFPMCAGGPGEAWFGDADQALLTEWAEACRQRDGVVIRPHFPSPICEEPVYMMLDKVDGVELRQVGDPSCGTLDAFGYSEWYRYLNCGCRVAAVGGTDKMSAGMPVGGIRTYAKLQPDEEFTFANWANAVRAGRTFTTSGAIIDLTVEGRSIGDELRLPAGGGRLEIRAEAKCAWPLHLLEIVVNGRVVASATSEIGAKRLVISEIIRIENSCWIAARCGSKMQAQHCWVANLGAHTSPIYVIVDGQEIFNPSDAYYMLTLIDGGLTYLDTLSIRYSEDRHASMKVLFERAQRLIHKKLHEHGMRH